MAQSRYAASPVVLNTTSGVVSLTPRTPFRFRDRVDTIVHLATTGDSLHSIAARYYGTISSTPERLWWVLADFQPAPVIDPTLALEEGRFIYVPAPAVVQSEVLSGLTPNVSTLG